MRQKIRAVLYGVGPLGVRIGRFILDKTRIEVVGAIDLKNVGKDLGEVLGMPRKVGVAVTDDPSRLFSKITADVVFHATSSYLKDTFPQIAGCVAARMNVITSCEEASYPYYKHPGTAAEIDRLAKDAGVTILGAGINPGFLMDTLPIMLTGICQEVRRVRVTRMMFSGTRRTSFQAKIGTGMAPHEFQRMIDEGKITGHVGLVESVAMIADALGWRLDEIRELPVEPVIADGEVCTWTDADKKTVFKVVTPGQVAGLRSIAEGLRSNERVIELEFVAQANIQSPYDAIVIEGTPTIRQRIEGGVHGDFETVAIMVNVVPRVLEAAPGMVTMKDIGLLSPGWRV